ncbi:hypothetical protein CL619_02880 [archaeon]|nr:hypothetical protein [archaeon]|tara:strand:+ start:4336 stop:4956 length:621 start_codon:yes stop_codon:yes gene_type:complete
MNKDYSQLIEIFGSKLKSDEFLYLVNGIKPVLRQLFFEEEVEKVENFCKKENIFIVKSSFKIIFDDSEKSFSNKGIRVNLDDNQSGARVVYLSFDERKSNLSALSELQGDDKFLGELLGYPECCINYFLENFAENNTNPTLKNKDCKNQDSWMLDISLREQDLAIISHFPCSWNCSKSIEIAKFRLESFKENLSDRYLEITELMQK